VDRGPGPGDEIAMDKKMEASTAMVPAVNPKHAAIVGVAAKAAEAVEAAEAAEAAKNGMKNAIGLTLVEDFYKGKIGTS